MPKLYKNVKSLKMRQNETSAFILTLSTLYFLDLNIGKTTVPRDFLL